MQGRPGNVSLALNDGSRTSAGAAARLPAAFLAGLECAVVDLDGDRAPEIVTVTDGQPLSLLVWRNDGKGNFRDVTSTAVLGQVPTATFGAAADITSLENHTITWGTTLRDSLAAWRRLHPSNA